MCFRGHVFLPSPGEGSWLASWAWMGHLLCCIDWVQGQTLSCAASETWSWQSLWVDQTQGCWLILTHKRLIYSQNASWLIYRGKHLTWSAPFLHLYQLWGERDCQKVAQWAGPLTRGVRPFRCSITSGSAHQPCYLLNRNLLSRWSRCFWQGTQFENPVCTKCALLPTFPWLANPFLTYTLLSMCKAFQTSCSLTVVPKACLLPRVGLIDTKVPGGFTKKWESFLGLGVWMFTGSTKWLWSLARLGNNWYKSFIWLKIVLLL